MILTARHHARKWLIPHKSNRPRPHLLRPHGLALVVVAILGIQLSFNLAVTGHPKVLGYASSISAAQLVVLTNQQRTANGLPALSVDARLVNSSDMKAQDMFNNDYWAHNSPNGTTPWYWFGQAGYSYSYAGENLAKDFDTSSGVMDGWMNSPGHRANILSSNYINIGITVMNGTLLGEQTTLVVAHYGAPVAVAAAPTAPAAPAPTATAPRTITPVAVTKVAPPVAAATSPAVAVVTTPAAAPTPAPKLVVTAAQPTVTEAAPSPQNYSLVRPLARTQSWATILTIALLGLLLLVYLFTHMAVWRKGLHRQHRQRYWAVAGVQVSVVITLIIVVVATGWGSVA